MEIMGIQFGSTKKGVIDIPATKDEFDISRYIEGLAEFINTCNTPMTLSIQGDWGRARPASCI